MTESTCASSVKAGSREQTQRGAARDALIVLGLALALRLVLAALTADTYDPDEFVVLALSRDFSHGATPYRDFIFFHPPGILVLFRALQPLVAWWWPSARLFMLLIDCANAVLVWRIGALLYGRRAALAAGLIYGASPIALLASVRIYQDSLITALGLTGLLLLLSLRSPWGSVLAGACLGLAIWFKYPALMFLPVYVLAAPRRAIPSILAAGATAAIAFAPFVHQLHALYTQTVLWQLFHRAHTDPAHHLMGDLSFWLLLNPLALPALLRYRSSGWIRLGFGMGALFLFTSQVYYHYFVPVVPFASLLAAPLLVDTVRRAPRLTFLGAAIFLGLWTTALSLAPVQDGLSLMRFSGISGAVHVLDRQTTRNQRVLTDQFEYAYLAHRPSVADYFWDMRSVIDARSLERRLRGTAAVVGTGGGGSYPPGFITYLAHRHYPHTRVGGATIWLLSADDDAPGELALSSHTGH